MKRMHGTHNMINVPNTVTMDIHWLPALPIDVLCVVFTDEILVTLFKQNKEMIIYTIIPVKLWITANGKDKDCCDFMNILCHLIANKIFFQECINV